jgi:hypothetical protein
LNLFGEKRIRARGQWRISELVDSFSLLACHLWLPFATGLELTRMVGVWALAYINSKLKQMAIYEPIFSV